ncbi:MAG: Rdx family protein [Chloroflexi bacterium]|nr:Rdx family protein [Chloroflexota bacterium]
MTDEILNEREIEYFISSWKLVPGSGGVFDVWVNGERVFCKKEVGRHAEPGEVRAAINAALDKIRPADVEMAAS